MISSKKLNFIIYLISISNFRKIELFLRWSLYDLVYFTTQVPDTNDTNATEVRH